MSYKPQLRAHEANVCSGALPRIDESSGRYRMRMTCDPAELDRIFRLRFEVFNLELGEGLAHSYASMRDTDVYDPYCHHLLVEDIASRQLVGTYRLLSRANSVDCGFYSDNEFVLSDLPTSVLDQSVELGRACIRYEHRNSRVLFLLWLGLAQYLQATNARYFFGCCSLTSQSFVEAWQVMQYLEENGFTDGHRVNARAAHRCGERPERGVSPPRLKLPKLMRLYLQYGAKIASEPAIDREFSTIDYLALFDINVLDDRARKMFGLDSR